MTGAIPLRRALAVALLPVLLGWAGVAHGQASDLAKLLQGIGPKHVPPEGSVTVTGWLERDGAATELVLSFAADGAAKLVADPGIVLRPLPDAAESWIGAPEIAHIDATRPYFEPQLLVRLPVRATAGRSVGTSIEYAYCLADFQCLFGEATVEVQVPAG